MWFSIWFKNENSLYFFKCMGFLTIFFKIVSLRFFSLSSQRAFFRISVHSVNIFKNKESYGSIFYEKINNIRKDSSVIYRYDFELIRYLWIRIMHFQRNQNKTHIKRRTILLEPVAVILDNYFDVSYGYSPPT